MHESHVSCTSDLRAPDVCRAEGKAIGRSEFRKRCDVQCCCNAVAGISARSQLCNELQRGAVQAHRYRVVVKSTNLNRGGFPPAHMLESLEQKLMSSTISRSSALAPSLWREVKEHLPSQGELLAERVPRFDTISWLHETRLQHQGERMPSHALQTP